MSNFTKGPWTQSDGGTFDKDMIITTIDRFGSHQGEICSLDTIFDGPMGVEQLANAFLIEQALSMYELLDRLDELNCPPEYLSEDEILALSQIFGLLKKARGEL